MFSDTFQLIKTLMVVFVELSCVHALKSLIIGVVHKFTCGAPESLEFAVGVLLFSLVCFVIGLHNVPRMSTLGGIYVCL